MSTNGTFEWINPYKYQNTYITSITVMFRINRVIFNIVDSTYVATNTNSEDVTIHPRFLTISEIIAILNTITHTPFSLSTKASNYRCIWILFPHTVYFTSAPGIREILGLEGRTVILPASFNQSYVFYITRNRHVIQVYSSLVRYSDLKMPIANQNNNLLTTMIINNPTIHYSRSMENICISMITRFDRLMFVFKDLNDF